MNGSSVQHTSVRNEALAILSRLGVPESTFAREGIASSSPITGEVITHVRITRPEEANAVIGRAAQAFTVWRNVPPVSLERPASVEQPLGGQRWHQRPGSTAGSGKCNFHRHSAAGHFGNL